MIPFPLFLFWVGVLHDADGPLFWPIIAAPMAIVELVVGIATPLSTAVPVHVFQSIGDQPLLTDGDPNGIRPKDEIGDERARHDLDAAEQTQPLVRELNGRVIHGVLKPSSTYFVPGGAKPRFTGVFGSIGCSLSMLVTGTSAPTGVMVTPLTHIWPLPLTKKP